MTQKIPESYKGSGIFFHLFMPCLPPSIDAHSTVSGGTPFALFPFCAQICARFSSFFLCKSTDYLVECARCALSSLFS